jgi:hypothetical protein
MLLWQEYGDAVVARHVARFSGTRPSNWWRYESPAPLHTGEAEYDYLARHKLLLPQGEKRARA